MGENEREIAGRQLHEIELNESIRYHNNDPVSASFSPSDDRGVHLQIESWLNSLLCLDCTTALQKQNSGTPPPSECEL